MEITYVVYISSIDPLSTSWQRWRMFQNFGMSQFVSQATYCRDTVQLKCYN